MKLAECDNCGTVWDRRRLVCAGPNCPICGRKTDDDQKAAKSSASARAAWRTRVDSPVPDSPVPGTAPQGDEKWGRGVGPDAY